MSNASEDAALRRELLNRLIAQRAGGAPAEVRSVPDGEEVAASFAQQRLWFLDELTGGEPTYNVPFGFRLTGELSVPAVQAAHGEVFRRHQALRTAFTRGADGTLVQRVRAPQEPPATVVDLRAGASDGERPDVGRLIAEYGSRPFDLTADPLVRVWLIRVADDEHVLLLSLHHIISDGWSERMLFEEFAALYAGQVRGEPVTLPDIPYHYRDYTAWEYGVAARGEFEDSLAYWERRLAGAPPVLQLPHDRPRPPRAGSHGRTVAFGVDAETAAAAEALRAEAGTTTFTVAMAAFAVLLHRVTGVGDLVLGVPVANRGRSEWDRTYGLFVNTVVVRLAVRGTQRLREVVATARDELLAAQEHQHVPFDKVASRVAPGRDAAFTPLFQVMCNAVGSEPGMELPDVTVSQLDVVSDTSKFDLTLHVHEDADGRLAGGSVEYRTELFGEPVIDALIVQYRAVLHAITHDGEQTVAGWAPGGPPRPTLRAPDAAAPVASLAERALDQARRRPDEVAARDRDGATLSCSELADRAERAAARLPVEPGGVVTVAVSSARDRLVWTLGTLLAGGRVLLIDPAWPSPFLARLHALATPAALVSDGTTAFPSAPLLLAPGDDSAGDGGVRRRGDQAAAGFCCPAIGADGEPGLLAHPQHELPPGPADAAAPWSPLRALAEGEPPDAAEQSCQAPVPARRHVLDAYLHPVPPGLVGEVYADDGASAWVSQPARTAADFVPDPGGVRPGVRLRRTGALGRPRADGGVDVLGLTHRALTVDGVRVHPEAAEAALRELPGVREATVVPGGGGERVGCYVAGDRLDHDRTVATLARTLLRQEVPDRLVRLDALPRTPLGTVDHEALTRLVTPATGDGDTDREANGEDGWTTTERRLAELWAEVLGRTELGRQDDFFAVGGHSMLAIRLIARARREWGLDLLLRSVFEHPRLAEFAALLDRQAAEDAGTAQSIPVRTTGPVAPLSRDQEHLWFLHQFASDASLYNLTFAHEIEGELDLDALREAVTGLVRRYACLRSTIAMDGASPVQVIAPPDEAVPDHAVVDLTDRPDEAKRTAEADAAAPFDLRRGPLLRTRVYRLSADRHLFVLAVHHLVFDAWSNAIFQRELAELYRAAFTGRRAALPELAIQYPDYAAWQRAQQLPDADDPHLAYWTRHLADAPALLDLPTDRPRRTVRTPAAGMVQRQLPGELVDGLRRVSAAEGGTLYMTLLSAFAVLMHRYSGQRDILLGTTVDKRSRVELEDQIGYFVNTVVVRSRLGETSTFSEVLAEIRREILDGQPHREVPFAKLVERLAPTRSASHPPLVQVLLDMKDETGQPADFAGLTTRPVHLDCAAVDFDLVLVTHLTDDGLRAELEYSADIFDAETAERLLGHFHTLLESVVAGFEAAVVPPAALRLPITGEAERSELLRIASGRRRPPVEPLVLHQVFERQAERTPDAIALTHRDLQLSYARLNAEANVLARRLRALGVTADTCVGVFLDRGPLLFTAVLAILKAGGAYVPLDTSHPAERLRYMAEEAGVRLVLADADTAGRAEAVLGGPDRVLRVPEAADGEAETGNLPAVGRPENLAYVLYTSGSTGRPKGVAMAHQALLALMHWDQEEIPVRPGGAVLQFNSLGFDASFVEMFAAWQVGARLVVLPEDAARRNPAVVLAHLETGGVERWDTPYAGLINVVTWSLASGRTPLLRLRAIMSGGEQLQVTDDLVTWFKAVPGCRLINQYGPSEVNRATSQRLGAAGGWPTLPPIGRPADNTAVYVLDAAGELVPTGLPGEVYVGGDHLARGYANRPDLTAERFLPDPFSQVPGARMYRTGDLARYLPDSALEYLGRMDTQVKVRGHRVELGEIEAALQRLATVESAAVAAHGTGASRRLVAYLVLAEGAPRPEPSSLAKALGETLPEYMVPRAFLVLDRLPLTASGKLDRRRLPEPEETASLGVEPLAPDRVAPRDEHERRVHALWEKLLGREGIGVTDNFFELGGHSLLATQFVAMLRAETGVSVPVSTVFEAPTISQLCATVVWTRKAPAETTPRRRPRQRVSVPPATARPGPKEGS